MENKHPIQHSESIMEIAKALNAAQGEMSAVLKDKENPYFKSKYADIESLIEVARPILKKHGLAVMQWPVGKNGLCSMITHVSGEYIKAEPMEMTPGDNKPQTAGSLLTYMRRYSLQAILLMEATDDDGKTAGGSTYTESPKNKRQLAQIVKKIAGEEVGIPEMQRISKECIGVPLNELEDAVVEALNGQLEEEG